MLENLVVSFGPVAFGTVALLVIWKYIVKPELDSRKDENSSERKMLLGLKDSLDVNIKALQAVSRELMTCHQTNQVQTDALREMVQEIRSLRLGEQTRAQVRE